MPILESPASATICAARDIFGVDVSLAKVWRLTESQGLRFSWDVFNVTNAVRFNVGTLNQYLLYGTTLGDFSQTLTKPRVMQFGLRYSF
jgi:hypothetical protein